MVDESSPVVLKDSTKKSEMASIKPAKTDFVKKRDAKLASKTKASPSVDSKKKPTPVADKKPAKFVKRDKSKSPEPAAKAKSGGIFGGKNPLLKKPSKINKTLIATPSKFEIRSNKPRGRPPLGVRGKVAAKKS